MKRVRKTNATLAGLLLASACSRAGCSNDPTDDQHSDGGREGSAFDAPFVKDGAQPDARLDASASDGGVGTPKDAQVADVNAPGHEWLFDDTWTSVVTQPQCDVRVADVSKLKWPGFAWSNCGTGCQKAPVVNGPNALWKGARRTGSGSKTTQGVLTIYLAAGVRLPPAAQWAAALQVPAWKPNSILLSYGDDCSVFFSRNHTPVFQLLGDEQSATVGQTLPSGVVFATSTHKLGSRYFDLVGGWGHIAGASSVGVSSDISSTGFLTVHTSAGPLEDPRGAGDAVLWRDWSGPTARVFAWTKKSGARVLVQSSYHVIQHAVTDDRIVWVGATGNIPNEKLKTAQLFWSDLKLDPDLIVAKSGPVLPVEYSPDPVFAAGNWVTMLGVGLSNVLVADLDKNTLWAIPTPPGHFRTPLGISSSTLVVADATPGFGQPTQFFDQMVQYDLNQIASFANKLP